MSDKKTVRQDLEEGLENQRRRQKTDAMAGLPGFPGTDTVNKSLGVSGAALGAVLGRKAGAQYGRRLGIRGARDIDVDEALQLARRQNPGKHVSRAVVDNAESVAIHDPKTGAVTMESVETLLDRARRGRNATIGAAAGASPGAAVAMPPSRYRGHGPD